MFLYSNFTTIYRVQANYCSISCIVFVACSYCHRVFFQVRSLTLDALSDDQIDLLRSVGNAAANAVRALFELYLSLFSVS